LNPFLLEENNYPEVGVFSKIMTKFAKPLGEKSRRMQKALLALVLYSKIAKL
jgi:hypothetical protein